MCVNKSSKGVQGWRSVGSALPHYVKYGFLVFTTMSRRANTTKHTVIFGFVLLFDLMAKQEVCQSLVALDVEQREFIILLALLDCVG